ncbi:hypothetical protein ACJJI5_11815 [Microbulbifer sp. EKSA008]|uniref:hypothetical protein n=1 Tax=Microbulbifer sp. EKSA008 TaxID=3243367 RepID=UPI004042D651
MARLKYCLFDPTTGLSGSKSVEMKNWSSARSISGSTYEQFKAYLTGGSDFEYYFSNGLNDAMKGQFQNVFKSSSKANELFDANPEFFIRQDISDADMLIDLANKGLLTNHPLLDFVH